MTTRNDITGDAIKTKPASQKYYDNYDAIFGKKPVSETNDKPDNTTTDQTNKLNT